MFKTLLLICLCSASMAKYNITCESSYKPGIYFEPSSDNVRGRYIFKWCISRSVTASCWKVTINYVANENTSSCNKKNLRSGVVHSIFTENVQSNCTNICLAKAVDFVFNATCYHIQTTLGTQDLTSKGYNYNTTHRNNSYHYVADSYPKHLFTESKANVNNQNDGDDVIIDWYLGYVPATDYRVKFYVEKKVVEVPNSCSALGPQQSHVRCRARLDAGCYNTTFHHYEPWVSGFGAIQGSFIYTFCHAKSVNYMCASSELRAKHTERWSALGCALVLLLLVALLFGMRFARVKLELRRCTRRQWLAGDKRAPSGPATDGSAGRVLLLYARDSAHVSRAAQLLARLLRHCTGYEVVDLYSPEAVSAAAPAGGEWLRALLADAATRVLLLQTPATGLYRARLAPSASGSPTLEAPLLSQQVMWRCPHAADPLLQLALRLLTETAHVEPLPYKKYYVASIAGVQHYEAVPAVTPLRRYLLPHATDHLLDHIAAPLASPPSPEPRSTLLEGPDSLLRSPDSCFTAPQSYTVYLELPPSIPVAPPSALESSPSTTGAPPSVPELTPSAHESSPSTTGAPPSVPELTPSALESSPSTTGAPPSVPELTPSALESSPSTTETPPSVPELTPSALESSPSTTGAPPSVPELTPSALESSPSTTGAPPSVPELTPSALESSPSTTGSPPSVPELTPSALESSPSTTGAPPSVPELTPSALESSPSTTGAPPSVPELTPSALESSPATGTPLSAQEALSADLERSRLLLQLWSTLEEFRRYAMANPNYLYSNLVCE